MRLSFRTAVLLLCLLVAAIIPVTANEESSLLFPGVLADTAAHDDDNGIDYDDEEFRRMVKAEEERLMREEGDRIRKEAEKELKLKAIKEERAKLMRMLEEIEDNDDLHAQDLAPSKKSRPKDERRELEEKIRKEIEEKERLRRYRLREEEEEARRRRDLEDRIRREMENEELSRQKDIELRLKRDLEDRLRRDMEDKIAQIRKEEEQRRRDDESRNRWEEEKRKRQEEDELKEKMEKAEAKLKEQFEEKIKEIEAKATEQQEKLQAEFEEKQKKWETEREERQKSETDTAKAKEEELDKRALELEERTKLLEVQMRIHNDLNFKHEEEKQSLAKANKELQAKMDQIAAMKAEFEQQQSTNANREQELKEKEEQFTDKVSKWQQEVAALTQREADLDQKLRALEEKSGAHASAEEEAMIAREREFNERVVEWEKSREALLDEQKKQMSVKEEEIRALEERLKEKDTLLQEAKARQSAGDASLQIVADTEGANASKAREEELMAREQKLNEKEQEIQQKTMSVEERERLVRERETQLTTDEEATRHARTELEQQRQQHMGLGSGRRRKGAIDFGHIKECLGHSESDDPLGTPALGMKLFGFVLVSLIIPLLSLCCCCCCGGGGGNTQALEQKFAMSERKLRNELTALDKQRADAMEQARQARSSSDMVMHEVEQLRYEKSQTVAVMDGLQRDIAQFQHDLYVANELNAQLRTDLASVKDDQSDLYRALQRENDSLARELDDMKSTSAEQQSKILHLETSLAEAKSTADGYRNEHMNLEASTSKALSECDSKLAQSVVEKTQMELRMETLLQELSAVKIQNQSLEEALSAYKSSMNGTESEGTTVEDLHAQLVTCKAERDQIKTEMESLRKDLKAERKRHTQSLEKIAQEVAEQEARSLSHSTTLEEKRAKLFEDMTSLQTKLDSTQKLLEEKADALAKSDKKYDILKSHFHDELETTKAKLDQELGELAKVRVTERAQREQIVQLKSDLELAETQRVQAETRLAEIQQSLNSANARAEEAERHSQTMASPARLGEGGARPRLPSAVTGPLPPRPQGVRPGGPMPRGQPQGGPRPRGPRPPPPSANVSASHPNAQLGPRMSNEASGGPPQSMSPRKSGTSPPLFRGPPPPSHGPSSSSSSMMPPLHHPQPPTPPGTTPHADANMPTRRHSQSHQSQPPFPPPPDMMSPFPTPPVPVAAPELPATTAPARSTPVPDPAPVAAVAAPATPPVLTDASNDALADGPPSMPSFFDPTQFQTRRKMKAPKYASPDSAAQAAAMMPAEPLDESLNPFNVKKKK